MGDTLDKSGFAMPQAFLGQQQFPSELLQVVSTKVFEFAALEQIPHPFLGIQLRRISWQRFQMNPLGSALQEKVLDSLAAMDRCPIPNDKQFAGDLTRQQ